MHLPPGPTPLGEQLAGNPIMGGHQNFNEFMDPNMDPEIAEAIRISLQEEKERQEREKQKQQESSKPAENMEVPV